MGQDQSMESVAVGSLLEKVRGLRKEGYRLVQISATTLPEQFELIYSFDLGGHLSSLRLNLPLGEPRLPSISTIYGAAILYENEMHDLFNFQVEGMTVDFHGNLYKTAVKYPMGSKTAPTVPPAPAAVWAVAEKTGGTPAK